MSLDTKVIREAIATRITEFCNLTAFPFDVSNGTYPRAIVLPGSPGIEYHHSMRDLCVLNYRVEVRANAADAVSAQIALAQFVAAGTGQARSIIDALEDVATGDTTPTLGGVVENVHVESVELFDADTEANPAIYTAVFRVVVKAKRD
jgi:hypothetical protein